MLHICNGLIIGGAVICFGNSPHMERWPLWYWLKSNEKLIEYLKYISPWVWDINTCIMKELFPPNLHETNNFDTVFKVKSITI